MGDAMVSTTIRTKAINICRKAIPAILPGNEKFWKIYAPILKVLGSSKEVEQIHDKIVNCLKLNKKDVLLDAGCGYADFLLKVSDKIAVGIGIDFQDKVIVGAKAKVYERHGLISNISIEHADLGKSLRFDDNSISAIVSVLVLSYLGVRSAFPKEAARILAPEGRIALVTPAKGADFLKVLVSEAKQRKDEGSFIKNLPKLPLAASAVFFGKIAELKDWVGQWHFYTEGELVDLFESVGLRTLSVERVYADQAIMIIAEKPAALPGRQAG